MGRPARHLAAPRCHGVDLGPPAAYRWLEANGERFHFVQRYPWEPWHWGYTRNPRSSPRDNGGDGSQTKGAVPAFVPERFAAPLARAAQRWNVSAALLAAQLYAESNFNPLHPEFGVRRFLGR